MKVKPIEIEKLKTYENTRFNKNTMGISNSIKAGKASDTKSDYSDIVLISIMNELGYLKNALIKMSFNEASSFVEKIEGDNL